jgi:hypothetical protein
MKPLDWYGLYKDSWQGEIVEEAFAHPAKYGRGMVRAIYQYLIDQGYLKPGDSVVDPFGGVALGGLDAMKHGLHWLGCELEQKFVDLAQRNIELWERRYRPHFPAWGTARIIQGDSRQLAQLVGAADGVFTSPPYAETVNAHGEGPGMAGNEKQRARIYAGSPSENAALSRKTGYGDTPGQLGAMPEGKFDAAFTSPPYTNAVNGSGEGPGARHDPIYHNGENAYKQSSAAEYGRTPGNLGNMAGEGFEAAVKDACVTSPPFMGCNGTGSGDMEARQGRTDTSGRYTDKIPYEKRGFLMGKEEYEQWAQTCNLGSITTSQETFWTAARQIVEQTYQVLRPGAVAVFVTGDFVRNRQRVYFGRQWMALCEAVGFEPLEWVTCWKTETHGTQFDIFGNGHTRKVDRVSFFRRLANEKNPGAAILNEDVIIMRRPAPHTNGYHANGNGHK